MNKNKVFFLCINFLGFISTKAFTPEISTKSSGFIENAGQIIDQFGAKNKSVLYLLAGTGLNIQLHKSGFSYDTWKKNDSLKCQFHRVDIEFIGCNTQGELIPDEMLEDRIIYHSRENIYGTEIRQFEKVTYKNLYNNI